jgi:sigma-B regulation protein RsbU (phosphoserine phosphatase)
VRVSQTKPKSISILIVDDTPSNLIMLERVLNREGYNIWRATNGPEGRELAHKKRPDLIVLDIIMPGESGLETLAKLKEDGITATTPVIMLTAEEHVESKLEAFQLGAVDYITKPFHPEEVEARVSLHLRMSVATRALIERQTAELKQLQDAQTSMLTLPSQHPEARFAVFYRSLQEAGGDFYDVIRISDGIYGYFLADISGHDLATSFLVAALKALLNQNCQPIYSPNESMMMLNRVLLEILPEGKYLTACYVELNQMRKKVEIINMAHLPILWVPKNRKAELIHEEGDILGAFKDVSFAQITLKLEKGDRLFIFSDGLIERIRTDKLWTEQIHLLLEHEQALRDLDIEACPDYLDQAFLQTEGETDDDVVVLGFEV